MKIKNSALVKGHYKSMVFILVDVLTGEIATRKDNLSVHLKLPDKCGFYGGCEANYMKYARNAMNLNGLGPVEEIRYWTEPDNTNCGDSLTMIVLAKGRVEADGTTWVPAHYFVSDEYCVVRDDLSVLSPSTMEKSGLFSILSRYKAPWAKEVKQAVKDLKASRKADKKDFGNPFA